jgi:hypothetical protein
MQDATQESRWGDKKNRMSTQISFKELIKLRRRIERLMLRHPHLVLKIAKILRLN